MQNKLQVINEIKINKNGDYIADFSVCENSVKIFVGSNINCNLLLKNITKDVQIINNIKENSEVKFRYINDEISKKILINSNVEKGAKIYSFIADLSKANFEIESMSNLCGEGAYGEFKFSTIANEKIIKKYNVSFEQISPKTSTLFEGYGIALKDGEVNIKGITHITKNSIKCLADQKIRIVLFDKESKGKGSPTLKIDCDDIIANHACAIGSLNEDHIFYLKTRGLSDEQARKLLIGGYLLPIRDNFDVQEKEDINKYLEEYI